MFDYKEWWEENKEKVKAKRKKRYSNDPEYREEVKAKARIYYLETKKMPKGSRKTKFLGGDPVYTIGKMADILGKDKYTLRKYHREKIIPDVRENKKGWRFYTFEQAKLISSAFDKLKNRKLRSLKEVSEYLHKNWGTDESNN